MNKILNEVEWHMIYVAITCVSLATLSHRLYVYKVNKTFKIEVVRCICTIMNAEHDRQTSGIERGRETGC